uniref:Deoxyribonuclease TATDN1 n=1 Tax=Panstrongylus lignarius TaxID=156445 RepID=A0A224XSU1_9HEMI
MAKRRFIDIGANLIDSTFTGIYHGKSAHENDLEKVLGRAWEIGMEKIMITGTTYDDSKRAYTLSLGDKRLYCTVGCHPTHCLEFEKPEHGSPDAYAKKLHQLYQECGSKVVAFGEIGLDYDRLHFCGKEQQNKYFQQQLTVAESLKTPLFLHCRAAFQDLCETLCKRDVRLPGVVHSFDGTCADADGIIDLGLYIGINGCSLKTSDNLEVVKNIPVEKILIETDSPWCDIRPTHAGYKYILTKFNAVKKEKWKEDAMVKGRNEPATICQVLEVISALKEEDIDQLANQIYNNTLNLFFPNQTNNEESTNQRNC